MSQYLDEDNTFTKQENGLYARYCYERGRFTHKDCTRDDLINILLTEQKDIITKIVDNKIKTAEKVTLIEFNEKEYE